MPDFWTHVIAGQEMINKSQNERLISLFDENKEVFNFATQGPDFFFYNNFWPWKKEKEGSQLGEKLHNNKTRTLMIESYKYLKNSKKEMNKEKYDRLLTYFLGFLAHYSLDSETHPLIFKYGGSGDSHKKLEIELDIKFMNEKWNLNAEKISIIKAIDLGNELPDYIIDYYYKILIEIFNLRPAKEIINASYQDMKIFHKIFYTPQNFKLLFIKMLNKIVPPDILIYNYKENKNFQLLNINFYSEFNDFYKKAIKKAIKLYELLFSFLDGIITESELEDSLYNLVNKDFSGKNINN